jgi:ankyrin repeat protein
MATPPPAGMVKAVLAAARQGDIDALSHLLASVGPGVDLVNASYGCSGNTPLIEAGCEGHVEMVQCLLQLGANVDKPDAGGRGPMYWAAANGQAAVIRFLLDCGANPHGQGQAATPLLVAARENRVEVVLALLAHPVARDTLDEATGWGVNPLHVACAWGREEVVTILLRAGAYPLARTIIGDNVLDRAKRGAKKSVVRLIDVSSRI